MKNNVPYLNDALALFTKVVTALQQPNATQKAPGSLTKELFPKSGPAVHRGHLRSQKSQGNSGKIEFCSSSSK